MNDDFNATKECRVAMHLDVLDVPGATLFFLPPRRAPRRPLTSAVLRGKKFAKSQGICEGDR